MDTLKSPSSARSAAAALPRQPRRRTWGAWFGRLFLTLAAVVAVIAVLGFVKYRQIQGFLALQKSGAFEPPPSAVTTTVIHAVRWQPTLHAIGSLEAVQGVTVAADLPGVVKEIRFESGAAVHQGDVLVRLVTDQEQAQLDANVATRDLAMVSLKRARDLREKNANSQSDFDTAEANEHQAEANVAAARAAIDRKTIRAPFNGLLGIRRASLGQYLNSGDPVVALQSMDPIYVNFTLPQQNLRDFGVGAEIELRTDATGDAVFKGKVNAINSLVDSATRNFQAQAPVANPGAKLRPGMFANVDVLLGGERDVLPIPGSAIAYAPYGNSVFVIAHHVKLLANPAIPNSKEKILDTAVRQQFIKTDQTKGDLVAVTSGLKEGDEIVSSGTFKLQNFAPVTVDTAPPQAVKINNSVKPEAEANPKPEES